MGWEEKNLITQQRLLRYLFMSTQRHRPSEQDFERFTSVSGKSPDTQSKATWVIALCGLLVLFGVAPVNRPTKSNRL